MIFQSRLLAICHKSNDRNMKMSQKIDLEHISHNHNQTITNIIGINTPDVNVQDSPHISFA